MLEFGLKRRVVLVGLDDTTTKIICESEELDESSGSLSISSSVSIFNPDEFHTLSSLRRRESNARSESVSSFLAGEIRDPLVFVFSRSSYNI